MDSLCSDFEALSVEEKGKFLDSIGCKPHGHLYAYEIPLHNVHVEVRTEKRGGETVFHYTSEAGDWSLINMGLTSKRNVWSRLNYFHKFPAEYRPTRTAHVLYACHADTSWEDEFRNVCRLGGWDVGGKSCKRAGYFPTEKEWSAFLGVTGCGPTECAIVPSAVLRWFRENRESLPRYPCTAALCKVLGECVSLESAALFSKQSADWRDLTRRDAKVSLTLHATRAQEKVVCVTRPFDNSNY